MDLEELFTTKHDGTPEQIEALARRFGGRRPDSELRGFLPVTIIHAEIDPLLDDGAMLEQALRAAGASVERRVYAGVTHEFFDTAAVVKHGRDAQQYAGQRLRQALDRQ